MVFLTIILAIFLVFVNFILDLNLHQLNFSTVAIRSGFHAMKHKLELDFCKKNYSMSYLLIFPKSLE